MVSAQLRPIEFAAENLSDLIGQLGDSPEIRIAKLRIHEAVLLAAQHVAEQDSRRQPESMRKLLMDIFDRIAAAIAAKQSGDSPTYDSHLAAIDARLQLVDQSEADEQTRLGNIEAGLQKVADAVNPPAPADAGTGDGAAAQGDATGDAGATTADDTGASTDQSSGGDAGAGDGSAQTSGDAATEDQGTGDAGAAASTQAQA